MPSQQALWKERRQLSPRQDDAYTRRYLACWAMGGDATRAGATSCPRSGGFSPLSFPLGWKPALTSPVAHTMIVFLS